MNPLLFKAHPLQALTISLLIDPGAHGWSDYATVILVYLVLNLGWSEIFRLSLRHIVGFTPSRHQAYVRALPSLLCLLPVLLTVLRDVIHHDFRLADRALLLFILFVAVQMLTVYHAAVIARHLRVREMEFSSGLALSLGLLLLAIPYGLATLGLNAWLKII